MHPNHMGIIDAGIIHTDGDDNRFEFEVCSFARLCFPTNSRLMISLIATNSLKMQR